MSETPYQQLETRFRRLLSLRDAEAILQWDMATMMPGGGARSRGDQLAVLKAVQHGILTEPKTQSLLQAALDNNIGDGPEAANLREMQRMWGRATALSEDLVVTLSKARSASETIWRKARAEDDFALVMPHLEKYLSLLRQAAGSIAEKLNLSPYDALLDEYEPGGRTREIDCLFAELQDFLPDYLSDALARQSGEPPVLKPKGPFVADKQRALGVRLMKILGFDFEHGRIDESLHPFCGGTPDDVRITTRYDGADFTQALMAVLHETGHALYERGLPKDWRGQPAGQARSMGVHESQSLLIEMQVCRSAEFLAYATPLMAAAFNGAGPAWETENLLRLYTWVEPGLIRVDADEITYPAHVILRYNLEKAMLAGEIKAADLPAAWNEESRRLLGLTPANDRQGCLQDIHWFDGAWGYFPTYTLGAIMAAQLFEAAQNAVPGIWRAISKGDFAPLLSWLRENVHSQGSLLTSRELLIRATGRPLDTEAYKRHLQRRYLS